MHKLSRPAPPASWHDGLKTIKEADPVKDGRSESKRWEAFRNAHQEIYNETIDTLAVSQHGLCAYCEIKVSRINRQIEHIQPKKKSKPDNDLTFTFSNFALCCNGGTVSYCKDNGAFSDDPNKKSNTSCGAKKGDKEPCLNPYNLPEYSLFHAQPDTNGKMLSFSADEGACANATIPTELVKNTITILGLNCPRLSRARYDVWDEINKQIDEICDDQELSEDEKDEKFKLLIEKHLSPDIQFYTTALLCICHQLPDLAPHN